MNRKRNTPPLKPDTGRSPFAGCAILLTVVGMVTFLLVFSAYTLFRQFDEIAKFTTDKPAPVEVVSLENKEPDINRLAEKVENFRQNLADREDRAVLALDPAELNLAIASDEAFKELRGTFRVLELAAGKARIAISFPLNGRPRLSHGGERGWLTSDPRYLNGVMIARPELAKNEVVLRVDDIEVAGAKVPAEFVDRMSPYRIAERYTGDPAIGPAMAALNGVEVSDGKLVFSRVPGVVRKDDVSRAEVDSGARRLFSFVAIGACAFLVFVGFVLLIGVRAKRRKSRES